MRPLLFAFTIVLLHSFATAATTQPTAETSPTLVLQGEFRSLYEQWNLIPRGIERSKPLESAETREVNFYNTLTRQSEKAAVLDKRFALSHASPTHLQDALRKILTPGLGIMQYDEKHAELTVTEKPAILAQVAQVVAAMDTPKPAILYKVPVENVSQVEKVLKPALSPQGKLTSFKNGVFVLSDDIESLVDADRLFRQSRLQYSVETLKLRDTQWRSTPRKFEAFQQQTPLRVDTPFGGKIITVEQRSYPLLYAAPSAAIEAARQVATRGLGRVTFDTKTNMLTLTDRPEVLLRFDTYLRSFDTAKPARLFAVAPSKIEDLKKAIQEKLTPEGDLIAFEKDGVIIVREEEQRLRSLDAVVRLGLSKRQLSHSRPTIAPSFRPGIRPASRPASAPSNQKESEEP